MKRQAPACLPNTGRRVLYQESTSSSTRPIENITPPHYESQGGCSSHPGAATSATVPYQSLLFPTSMRKKRHAEGPVPSNVWYTPFQGEEIQDDAILYQFYCSEIPFHSYKNPDIPHSAPSAVESDNS